MRVPDGQRWEAAGLTDDLPIDSPTAYTRAFMYDRLVLWTSHSHATGRKLGEALRDHSWSGLARRGRL